jgi:hypothetical protein
VERVIIQILKPHRKDHIYDPTVGSGGFLLEAFHYLKEKEGEPVARTLYLYGQELNIGTFAIAKINMFLHGLDSADIQRGATLTFTKIKAILVKAAEGNTNNVVVGGAASNGWVGPFGDVSDTVAVKPGGTLLLVAPNAAGYAVTAGTGDILKVANSGAGTGVTYDIVIVGV